MRIVKVHFALIWRWHAYFFDTVDAFLFDDENLVGLNAKQTSIESRLVQYQRILLIVARKTSDGHNDVAAVDHFVVDLKSLGHFRFAQRPMQVV